MHGESSPGSGGDRREPITAAEDARAQHAVLIVVLDRHPAILTLCELGREIEPEGGEPTERAVGDLVRAGLLRREGASVLPTRAALHFDSLPW
ncbi:MAG TPA: hypothetical protein VF731_00695 [Solirubrobacterales bacterium]